MQFMKSKMVKSMADLNLSTTVPHEQTSGAHAREMIVCDNLVKIYKTKDTEVLALQGMDMTIHEGEFVAIIGRSGSGKSTFLNMIGGLDRPSAGRLLVDELDLFKLSEDELVSYKRRTVGFIWQNNARNLLPYLTALQNIELPMEFMHKKEKRRQVSLFPEHRSKTERAEYLLDLVGLADKKNSRLAQLSGGEQQRIAIAIALANEPRLLLADEPTGSVDVATSNIIFDLFQRLNREFGLTIVMVTHDQALSQKVSRVINIQDGKISSERLIRESYVEQLRKAGSLADASVSAEASDDSVAAATAATVGASASASADSHEEFLIMDRVGRVQLPREVLDDLGFTDNKVRLRIRDGRLELMPGNGADPSDPTTTEDQT